jgi:uncharacterized membrane protein
MTILILGLILFLGIHSVRIVGEGWRATVRARIGEGPWKGIYSLVSLLGFGLIVWGFGLARQQPVLLWHPPVFMRHIAGLLVLIAFVFLAATYVPRNGIKAKLHHPMILGVKIWALAHLVSNGALHDLVLFGSFLVWAVFDFRAARRRDAVAGIYYAPGMATGTVIALIVGLAAWAMFAFWLHGPLIGVRPFG